MASYNYSPNAYKIDMFSVINEYLAKKPWSEDAIILNNYFCKETFFKMMVL